MGRAADALKRASPSRGPRPLSLEDALLREPVEDRGGITVEALDTPRRLLTGLMIRTVRSWAARHRPVEAGLDSSSRPLETGSGALAVAGVAVAGLDGHFWEHPWLERPDRRAPGFIAVVGAPSAGGWPFVGVSPAGYEYSDYSLEQVLDEARLSLENWALKNVVPRWVERAAGRGMTPVVLVDGPVVPVTMAFQAGPAGDKRYVEAWRRLAIERLRAVESLERSGALVLGVVKRIDKSRILGRIAGLVPGLERLAGAGDQQVLYEEYRRLAGSTGPFRVLRGPRLRVIISGRGLEEAIVKIVEHVVVPPGAWAHEPLAARYYRVEYLPGTQRMLDRLDARGAYLLALASVLRGSLEPVAVKACDYRSRRATRAVRQLLLAGLQAAGVPLSYSGEVEVRAG